MIIVAGHFTISNSTDAKEAMESMVLSSRLEHGCLTYSYAFDLDDPHLVRVFEIWENMEAYQSHTQSSHLRQWREKWEENGFGERMISVFEADRISPSVLPIVHA